MSRGKSLIKNTIIYAIGNFGSKLINFIFLPLYTYYLSKSDYGYYDLVMTTITLFLPIISFQINDGAYRYLLSSKNNKETKNVFTNSLFIIIINMISSNILCFVIFNNFYKLMYANLIIILFDLMMVTSLVSQALRGLKDNVRYTISGLINSITLIIFNIIFVVFLHKYVDGLLISNILSNICVLLYLISTKIFKNVDIKCVNKRVIKRLAIYSIPLIPNVISWWVMNVSDRYLLNHYLGMGANGLYAIANKFPSLISTLGSLFYMAWQESAITEYNSSDRDKYYSRVFKYLYKFMFTGLIVLLPFTKIAVRVMISKSFSDAVLYIPFLYFGAVFSVFSWFYGTGYLSAEKTMGAFTSSVIGASANIVFNIVFIPYWGIQAASFSTMLAFLIMWIIRIYQTKRFYKVRINTRLFTVLIIICIVFIGIYYINNIFVELISFVFAIIIFIFFNMDIVKSGILFIRKKI